MEIQDIKFHHRVPVQLRFTDIDQFGHMNNSVYFSLFDMAKTQYFGNVMGLDVFRFLGVVVVNVNADFLSPVHYGEEIAIETAIVHLGHKSLTVVQQALNVQTGDVKCVCKTIMVCFDMKSKETIELPQDLCDKVLEYEGVDNLKG